MNQRRGRFQRLDRIIDIGQLFVLNVDQTDRLIGDRFGIGCHSGERVAGHANFVFDENGLILHPRADENIFDIGAREHGAHARQLLGFRSINADDTRVRHRAAQHLRPQQAFERQISGVLSLTGYLPIAFDTRLRFSDAAISQESPPKYFGFSILDFGLSEKSAGLFPAIENLNLVTLSCKVALISPDFGFSEEATGFSLPQSKIQNLKSKILTSGCRAARSCPKESFCGSYPTPRPFREIPRRPRENPSRRAGNRWKKRYCRRRSDR